MRYYFIYIFKGPSHFICGLLYKTTLVFREKSWCSSNRRISTESYKEEAPRLGIATVSSKKQSGSFICGLYIII